MSVSPWLVEGAPDDEGQMTPAGFCSIFGLKVDEYTDRLVKIFDLDNSNAIGFREFLYGLSKFQVRPSLNIAPHRMPLAH
jgi:serine/threonine-protein phosphatase 2B regulatory subunit